MLRAKAVKFRHGEVRLRDRLLSSTDAMGKLAAIPVVAQTVNAVNRLPVARKLMDAALGIDARRVLPEYASGKFRKLAEPQGGFTVQDGANTPGKVALFATCYVNYNEPGIGEDLLALLAHNAIPAVLVDKEACCGMPKLELGDLEGVARLKDINIPPLVKLAREGYAILTPIPSCTLMFKSELPLMFPGDADVKAVAEAMFDPFEYLVLRHRDGLLKTDFKTALGKVSYHIPCQNTRGAGAGARDRDQYRRALFGPRRHLGREVRIFRQLDENRASGISPDGIDAAGLDQFGLSDRRAPHRAGHGRERSGGRGRERRHSACKRKKSAPADLDAHCLRHRRELTYAANSSRKSDVARSLRQQAQRISQRSH
jgi:hypothetical protein